MNFGRNYRPNMRISQLREQRTSRNKLLKYKRNSVGRESDRNEIYRKFANKYHDSKPYRRREGSIFESHWNILRFMPRTPSPRRRRRSHSASTRRKRSFKLSSGPRTPPPPPKRERSPKIIYSRSSLKHKSRYFDRLEESKNRSKEDTKQKKYASPSQKLPCPDNLPSLGEDIMSSMIEFERVPTESKLKFRRRKKRLLRKIYAVSSLFCKPYSNQQEFVFFNYQVESLFADILSSYMVGRRRVMSQKQICMLANRLMTLECPLVDEWCFVVENSAFNSDWLKKFCSRNSRIAQFVDGMNGNWFWRKNILTKIEFEECFSLCKHCLNLKFRAE